MAEKKYLIIAGHGKQPNGSNDPGAVGNGTTEASFIREKLFPAMKKYAPSNVTFKSDVDVFAHRLAKSISGFDEIIEYHLDAGVSSAEDGHVIIYKTYKPDEMDNRIRDVIKKHVGIRGSNGFSYRDNLYNLNKFAERKISYRLVELAFITNKKEMDYVKANIDAYAKDMVEAIIGKGVKAPASPVKRPDVKDATIHTVKAGDTLWGIAGKYNVTVANIKSWNELKSDTINVGQKLELGAQDTNVIEQPKKPDNAPVAKPAPAPAKNTSNKNTVELSIQAKVGVKQDGILGRDSKVGIVKLAQRWIGVDADGAWGNTSYSRSRTTSPPENSLYVYAVQAMLYAKGFKKVGTPDGKYGNNTALAVKDFQKANGLIVDGIAGKATQMKLFKI